MANSTYTFCTRLPEVPTGGLDPKVAVAPMFGFQEAQKADIAGTNVASCQCDTNVSIKYEAKSPSTMRHGRLVTMGGLALDCTYGMESGCGEEG